MNQPDHEPIPKLLTLAEAADASRRTVKALRQLRSRGGGPKMRRVGGRLYVEESDLVTWLRGETVSNSPTLVPDPLQTPFMRPDQVASLLGLNVESVRNAMAAGEIPSIRLGRSCLVPTKWLIEAAHLNARGDG